MLKSMFHRNVSSSSELMWTQQPTVWLNKSSNLNQIPFTLACCMEILGKKVPCTVAVTACSNIFAQHLPHFVCHLCDRNIGTLLQQLPGNLCEGTIDGMLLDLGVSSMQVSILTMNSALLAVVDGITVATDNSAVGNLLCSHMLAMHCSSSFSSHEVGCSSP